MLTLSYGYKKPQTNDKGSVFFPAIEFNFQRLNDHTHDGSNSAKLSTGSVVVSKVTLSNGSWVSQGGGTYRQLVTMPGTLLYDNYAYSFKLSTGQFFYPTVEKVSSTTFYVYVNDNSLSAEVIILS